MGLLLGAGWRLPILFLVVGGGLLLDDDVAPCPRIEEAAAAEAIFCFLPGEGVSGDGSSSCRP